MSTTIKIKEILPKVLHVIIKDQYKLGMTFVRIQEFYESPEFKGKYFTLEDYMDWYCGVPTLGNGDFTYPTDWNGMNLPGSVMKQWLNVCADNFDYLRHKEIMLRDAITKHIGDIDNIDQYYIIGTTGSKSASMDHEIAHAIYTLYPEYKKSCDSIISKFSTSFKKKLQSVLIDSGGYCKDVVPDEVQAYLSTSVYICNTNIRSLTTKRNNAKVIDIKNLFEKNFKSFRKSLT